MRSLYSSNQDGLVDTAVIYVDYCVIQKLGEQSDGRCDTGYAVLPDNYRLQVVKCMERYV